MFALYIEDKVKQGQSNQCQTPRVKGEQGTAELGAKTVLKQTNKLFLETEATFSYCNWSIKKARIIGFGSRSIVNSWQRLGRLLF